NTVWADRPLAGKSSGTTYRALIVGLGHDMLSVKVSDPVAVARNDGFGEGQTVQVLTESQESRTCRIVGRFSQMFVDERFDGAGCDKSVQFRHFRVPPCRIG